MILLPSVLYIFGYKSLSRCQLLCIHFVFVTIFICLHEAIQIIKKNDNFRMLYPVLFGGDGKQASDTSGEHVFHTNETSGFSGSMFFNCIFLANYLFEEDYIGCRQKWDIHIA